MRFGLGLPGLSASEVRNFIDGRRTVLDIYRAVRAECGNLVIGDNALKFAYVLSPDAPDVDLNAVVTLLRNMETAGTIEIVKVAPKPVPGKKKT